MAVLNLLLLFSVSSIEGKYYFTPLSADIGYDFFDIHSLSFGIGTNRLIIGTSILESKAFPFISPKEVLTYGKYSMEILPINIFLLLKNDKRFNLYGYFCSNEWLTGPLTDYDYNATDLLSYGYFRIGIGTTIYSFVRLSIGYFNGSFVGRSNYPDTIPSTKFKSNALYATMGFGLPDLWKDFKFESHTTNSSLTDIILQFGGGGTGSILGLFAGYSITWAAISMTELFGAHPYWTFPSEASSGVMWGGLAGMVAGFPIGFQLTGKFLHRNSPKNNSQSN